MIFSFSRLILRTHIALITTLSAGVSVPAFAQESEHSALGSILPLIFIVVIFYLFLIRPQQKRAKAHRNMLDALSVGDEVLTSGGIFGKVVKITDNAVLLETGKSQMFFQKQSIQSLLPPGSLEKL